MIESYVHGFIGGTLIGLAAVILFLLNGKIMGVSSIISRLLEKPIKDHYWRICFLLGLLSGGFVWSRSVNIEIAADHGILMAAGLLVGIGTVLANGCTSGHGICGIARFSKRSIVATLVFILAGIITVLIKRSFAQ